MDYRKVHTLICYFFSDDDAIKRLESLQFDLLTLRAATEDFCDANKLGQGGFGAVYKVIVNFSRT